METEEQQYETDYDFPETPKDLQGNTTDEQDKRTALTDQYDLMQLASNVHSKNTSMSTDYTLTRYNTEIINAKFPKFVRNQRKAVRILESFMIPTKQELLRRYTPETVEKILLQARQDYKSVEGLLLGEVDEMVIIARSGKGEVIESILHHGSNVEDIEEMKLRMKDDTVKSKLQERS